MSLRPAEFVDRALGGTLEGDPGIEIARLAPLEAAQAQELSFLSHPRYQQQLAASGRPVSVVAPAMREVAMARAPASWRMIPPILPATQLWRRRHAPPGCPEFIPVRWCS